jgi:excisionase family DNA binding protein
MTLEQAFLSIKQAAAITSLSDESIRQLISRGELEAVRCGTRILIPTASLQEWIDDKTDEARQERNTVLAQQALRGRYAVTDEPMHPTLMRLRERTKKPPTRRNESAAKQGA